MSEATKDSPAMTDELIWREGPRIRSRVGGGYNDIVPDESLAAHAANPELHEVDRAFAAATLAIRRYERAVRARRQR
jgi:hypothetical protein